MKCGMRAPARVCSGVRRSTRSTWLLPARNRRSCIDEMERLEMGAESEGSRSRLDDRRYRPKL